MDKVILQIPVDIQLRRDALTAAHLEGFSSLQEMVRVILRKIAARTLSMRVEEDVRLSPRAERRYLRMEKDFEQGKNVYTARSVDELMKQLHEHSSS